MAAGHRQGISRRGAAAGNGALRRRVACARLPQFPPEPAMSPKPLLLGLCLLGGSAVAQPAPMHGHAHGVAPPATALPVLPGQDAFAALQEIVRLLEADPATDWTRVDLDALRMHLVDMAEVMLHAETATRRIEATWVTYLRNNLLHKKPAVYYRQGAQ